MRSNVRDATETPSRLVPPFCNRANTRVYNQLRRTYLTRDGREPAHKGVTVVAARRAIVVVLDDDRLLARVAALKDNNNLTGLRTRSERKHNHISSVVSFISCIIRAVARPCSAPATPRRPAIDDPHPRARVSPSPLRVPRLPPAACRLTTRWWWCSHQHAYVSVSSFVCVP